MAAELDALLPYLIYLRREELCSVEYADMWLGAFPDLLHAPLREPEKLHEHLWKPVLERAQILRLAYSYRGLHDIDAAEVVDQHARQVRREMTDDPAVVERARQTGAILWTSSFFGDCAPARLIEAAAGLGPRLKQRLALDTLQPGLLFNYVHARHRDLEDAIDPRQFEELIAAIFRAEGWAAQVTKETRDGGKDVIAERCTDGVPELVYIQAKRNRRDRAVTISEVKEFAATLAGDDVRRGYIVTTSHVSPPGVAWAQSKGAKLARVEVIDRERLIARLDALSGQHPGVFELPGRP